MARTPAPPFADHCVVCLCLPICKTRVITVPPHKSVMGACAGAWHVGSAQNVNHQPLLAARGRPGDWTFSPGPHGRNFRPQRGTSHCQGRWTP